MSTDWHLVISSNKISKKKAGITWRTPQVFINDHTDLKGRRCLCKGTPVRARSMTPAYEEASRGHIEEEFFEETALIFQNLLEAAKKLARKISEK